MKKDKAEPNYQISHPESSDQKPRLKLDDKFPEEKKIGCKAGDFAIPRRFFEKGSPTKDEFSAYTETIESVEKNLTGIVYEAEDLEKRQKSLQEKLQSLSLDNQDEKTAKVIANALEEIQNNLVCLEKLYDEASDTLVRFRAADNFWRFVLEKADTKTEH